VYRVDAVHDGENKINLGGENVRGWRAQIEQVCASAASTITVQQAWMPGWQAWVDGTQVDVHQVGVFWQIEMPEGCHQVSIAYRPTVEIISAAVSGLTGLILGASLLIQRKSVSA
jgi:uncharacterized membrane protein YfhO